MKKFIKFFSATLLVVILLISSTACFWAKTADCLFDQEKIQAVKPKTYTSIEKISALDNDYTCFASSGNVLLFKQTDVDAVNGYTYDFYAYNVAKNLEFAKKSNSSNFNALQIVSTKSSCFVTYTDKDGKITVYDTTSGNEVASKVLSVSTNLDLIKADDKIFSIDESGKISSVTESKGSIFSSITDYSNGYYYNMSDSQKKIYDNNLNLYGFIDLPSYAENVEQFILENGNVLIQYKINADKFGTKYDIYDTETESKFDVVTILYNVEKNTVKEVEFDYEIYNVITKSDLFAKSDVYNGDIENIAVAFKIEDKLVNRNSSNVSLLRLSNNLNAKLLKKAFPTQDTANFDAIAPETFMATNIAGQKVILDKDLEVTSIIDNYLTHNHKYIIANGNLYNLAGAEIYNYADQNFSVVKVFETSVLFRKTTEAENAETIITWFLYHGGKAEKIASTDKREQVTTTPFGYIVSKTDKAGTSTEYTLYSEIGKELKEFDYPISIVSSKTDKGYVVYTSKTNSSNETEYTYYLVK